MKTVKKMKLKNKFKKTLKKDNCGRHGDVQTLFGTKQSIKAP